MEKATEYIKRSDMRVILEKAGIDIELASEPPNVEINEVIHAHWENPQRKCREYHCSACGAGAYVPYYYCPHCGAWMDRKG